MFEVGPIENNGKRKKRSSSPNGHQETILTRGQRSDLVYLDPQGYGDRIPSKTRGGLRGRKKLDHPQNRRGEEKFSRSGSEDEDPYLTNRPGLQIILGPQLPDLVKDRMKECLGDVILEEEDI